MRETDLIQLRRHLEGIAIVGGYGTATLNLSDLDRPERYEGAFVSGDLFGILGMAPVLGRDFTRTDERDGAPTVVMMSHALWKSRYASDPGVIGRQIRVDAEPATIVGVMPEDFSFPSRKQVWTVGHFVEGAATDRDYSVVVRQSPGVQARAIESALSAWAADAARAEPTHFRGLGVAMEPAFSGARRGLADISCAPHRSDGGLAP
jgi:hypothetical protein